MIVEKESSLVKNDSKISEHTENSSSEAPIVAQLEPPSTSDTPNDEFKKPTEVEKLNDLEPVLSDLVEEKSDVLEAKSETDNFAPLESHTSYSGSWKILECMLRISVEYPKQKVVDLIANYDDFLEETGLLDAKDVKRREKLQTIKSSEQDEDAKSVVEENDNEINTKLEMNEVHEIPVGTKNLGYYNVLKDMITRMELEGTLGKRREYGRTTKGGKINEQKDEEYYYNLDDDFIDDNELVNNESMHKDFSQHELINENNLDKFYEKFEFLSHSEIKNYSSYLKAKKRKRMEDEQISDPKINEKWVQLEKAVHESKDGTINGIMHEIALRLKGSIQSSDWDWSKYKEEIYLKLQRIFKESDRSKIKQVIKSFVEKQNTKDEMNNLSDMLFRYIEMKKKTKDSDNIYDYIDQQAKEIIETIKDEIQKYLHQMNIFKVFKIHWGVKKLKMDDDLHDKLTGDLKNDAKIYMKLYKQDDTLKGIFLKEKITSNTVLKKIKDIILLFDEKMHDELLKEFENLLGYKIDVLVDATSKIETNSGAK